MACVYDWDNLLEIAWEDKELIYALNRQINQSLRNASSLPRMLHWLYKRIHYQAIYTKPIHHIMFCKTRFLVEHPSFWSTLQLHTMGCNESITSTHNQNVRCKFTRHNPRNMTACGWQITTMFDSIWQGKIHSTHWGLNKKCNILQMTFSNASHIHIKISQKCVSPLDNISALAQTKASRNTKSLPKQWWFGFQTDISVTIPQCINFSMPPSGSSGDI